MWCGVPALIEVLDGVKEVVRVSSGETVGVRVGNARKEILHGGYTDHVLGDCRGGGAEDP